MRAFELYRFTHPDGSAKEWGYSDLGNGHAEIRWGAANQLRGFQVKPLREAQGPRCGEAQEGLPPRRHRLAGCQWLAHLQSRHHVQPPRPPSISLPSWARATGSTSNQPNPTANRGAVFAARRSRASCLARRPTMHAITQITDQLTLVMLDIRIWSGRKKLRPEDLRLSGDEIPPEDLVSLGSKRVCDPESLKAFYRLKQSAERACLRVGTRFLGGFAIPQDQAEAAGRPARGAEDGF